MKEHTKSLIEKFEGEIMVLNGCIQVLKSEALLLEIQELKNGRKNNN